MFKNKWLLIGLILMTIFSSIGNSVSVIAETFDSSSLETSDTLGEQELSSDIGVENGTPMVESEVQEKMTGDLQIDKKTRALNSSEIQSQTRDWSPSPGIQAEAIRNWVSQQLDSYFNLSNDKLGKNVGDKIVKTVNFPDYMGIAAYQGEGKWNGQWHIQLGKTKLDSNGYFKFSNFSFTHSSDISVSLSGSDTDKTRTLTITRLNQSPDERYSIKANYYFESRGVMYNDYGIISGVYNTIYPSGDGKQIDMQLEAEATLGNALVMGQSEYNDNGTIPFTEAFIFQLKGTELNIGVAGSSPYASIDPRQPSQTVMKAEFGSLEKNVADYFKASGIGFEGNGSDTQGSLINQWTNSGAGSSSIGVSDGVLLHLWSNISMKDGTNASRIQRSKESVFYDDNPEKVSDMFYQVYKGEFHPLSITKLKQVEEKIAIDKNVTNVQLESLLKNGDSILNFSNYANVSPIGFKTYPTRQNGGQESTAVIQVSEKLKDGKTMYYDYEVIFKVKDESITANPNKQTVNLGSDFSKVSPYSLVKDVKLGNQILSQNDYTVSVQNSVSTDTVGDKTVKVLMTYKKDTSKTLSLDVPVQVLWGNTIGSNNVIYSSKIALSLSLITEETPQIIATSGEGSASGSWINDYQSGTYIKTNIYKNSQILNSNLSTPYIKFQVKGQENMSTAKNRWNGLSNKNEIAYGDILQYDVLTSWGDNKWVRRDEVRKFESLGKQSIYYEITKEGYRTLHLNHLETKNVTIPIYSTEEYLDKNIKDYIDLKGYTNISVKEFSQYPNTKASGQQKGKIIVEETLTTGKKVQYEYEVTFIIGEGELTYSVPKTLTFKEFTKSKSEQTIQRMYSGDLGVKISDNRGQGKQGNWRLTAQVNQSEELSPYLIFRDGTSQDKYLNQGTVEIYSQAKQSNPTEPLNVEVSDQWLKDTGILLKVPSKNHLSSKQYTSKITWNLVEGP
ncbi:hypothetical protein [Lactococcus petauri]|uniref:hypothetical protein n=1 Tax=Lactococcus petauri TaxID=1940789 RepID=UPI00254A57F9|nr:hypothetical protein [Lactococcus petauri]